VLCVRRVGDKTLSLTPLAPAKPMNQTEVREAVVPRDFVTPREAAQRMRVSKAALYEWLRRGELRSYRAGRLLRIRESDIATYLNARRSEPSARSSYASRPPQ